MSGDRPAPRVCAILDPSKAVIELLDAPFEARPWLGRPFTDLVAREDRVRVTAALDQLCHRGVIDLAARLTVDERGPWRFHARAGGRLVVVELEPIPEQPETFSMRENRLEQLGLVTSQVSHDLKNLLAAVMINAELIPRTTGDLEGIREVSREIVVATDRARELLEQILGYASATPEPLRLVDLNALTREMGRLLEVAAPPTVALRYELDGELPQVRAHAPQLRQILMNFIVNAGEAIGAEVGAITISTRAVEASAAMLGRSRTTTAPAPGRYVCLQVEDTGPGLEPRVAQQLFDPFFTTKRHGHGLGLSACRTIVEEHGGGLLLESTPGEGATFQVLLPAIDEPRPEVVAPAPTRRIAHELQGHRVLVVDDDALMRSVVRRTLLSHGLAVLTARDGLDGIDMFEQHHRTLSCVLLDMGMPHVSGSDVFEDIKSIDPDVPVVFASGHGHAQLYAEESVLRAEGLLLKPFRERELLQMLQRVIDTRRGEPAVRARSHERTAPQ